jgi:hypothetical protein
MGVIFNCGGKVDAARGNKLLMPETVQRGRVPGLEDAHQDTSIPILAHYVCLYREAIAYGSHLS